MKTILPVLSAIIFFSIPINAQEEAPLSPPSDTKSGLIPGGVPAVAYDEDVGFLYGIVLNFFHYGDGSRYPRYDHSFYPKTKTGDDSGGVPAVVWLES